MIDEIRNTHEGILISPASVGKLSLEESFAAMAEDSSDLKNSLEWAESGFFNTAETD
jgi:hypothetical protein